MKDNNQLDFNFDNQPVRPSVDRTSKAKVPSQRVDSTPSSHSGSSNPLTATEIIKMNKQTEEPKKATSQLKFNNPPQPKPQSTALSNKGEYSSAALSIMQKMQQKEGSSEPQKVSAATISTKAVAKKTETAKTIESEPKEVKAGQSDPTEMMAFLSRKTVAATPKVDQPQKVEHVIEQNDELPIMPIKRVTDLSDVADSRKEMIDSFTLDATALETGFDSLDDQPTTVLPIISQKPDIAEDDGGTKMFDAPIIEQDIGDKPIDIDALYEQDEQNFVIDEYNSVEDAQSVTHDLTRRKRKLTIRCLLTTIFAILLILVTFVENLFPFGQTPYFVCVGVLLGLTAIVNLSTLQSLISIFKLKPDLDFAPSFALVCATLQTVVAAFMGVGDTTATSMFASVAAVSMLFSTIAKRITVKRTLSAFELIANEEPKEAGAFIAPPSSASIADPEKIGESLIFGRKTTIDFKSFISNSLSADLYEKLSDKLSTVIVIASAIACIGAAIKEGSLTDGVTALASVACAGAQIAAFYPSAVMLARSCKKLLNQRVMIGGFKATEEISEANVVVLDSDELFCDEGVSLYKFRTFEDVSPDDAFMTAASLTLEGHSPLAGMFTQIASTNGVGMLSADSVIYEDGMGLTGWVNERKTLLGNRMIMESHSIPVPPIDVDRKVLKGGYFPLYLAIDDKLAAMFIIGYSADKDMLHRVRRLINTGVTLLVRTVDPNVTADLICDSYGLPTGSVEVMSAHASRIYSEHMAPSDNEPSILYAPDAKGFVDAYIASFKLNRSAKVAAVATIVLTMMCVALCILMPIFGFGVLINCATLLSSYVIITIITALAGIINS